MTDKRSLFVYKNWKESQQKFDYFVLGLAAAVFAYIGESYVAMPISVSQNSVELLSLLFLLISILAGFKRLEFDLALQQGNFYQLDLGERKGTMHQVLSAQSPALNTDTGEHIGKETAMENIELINKSLPGLIKSVEKYSKWGGAMYSIRNWSLLTGFALLAVSKLVGVYVTT